MVYKFKFLFLSKIYRPKNKEANVKCGKNVKNE